MPVGVPAGRSGGLPTGFPGSGEDSRAGCGCGCGKRQGNAFPGVPLSMPSGGSASSPVQPPVTGRNRQSGREPESASGGVSRGRTSTGGGTPKGKSNDPPYRPGTVAEPRHKPGHRRKCGEECHCPTIPVCPEVEPGRGDGDGWCLDCFGLGDPKIHCGLPCYRSYGTGTVGGQQCCYVNGKLVTRAHPTHASCMGTIDLASSASGEVPTVPQRKLVPGAAARRMRGLKRSSDYKTVGYNDDRGCCNWGPGVVGHWGVDLWDSKKCPGYDAMQDCMRKGGDTFPPIPSGDASGGRPVTDDELIEAYDQCKRKHCHETPGTAAK